MSTDVSCPAPHRTAPFTLHSTYAIAALPCPRAVACSVKSLMPTSMPAAASAWVNADTGPLPVPS